MQDSSVSGACLQNKENISLTILKSFPHCHYFILVYFVIMREIVTAVSFLLVVLKNSRFKKYSTPYKFSLKVWSQAACDFVSLLLLLSITWQNCVVDINRIADSGGSWDTPSKQENKTGGKLLDLSHAILSLIYIFSSGFCIIDSLILSES